MNRFFCIILFSLLCTWPVVAQQPGERSSSIVTIDGESYYVHTVQKGETEYSLSRLYLVTESDLEKNNPHIAGGLQAGQVLKIPVVKESEGRPLTRRQENRLFDKHTVNQGETLSSISRRYEIPLNTLIEDNPGLDPSHLSIGQEIRVRKKSRGDASPEDIDEQMEEYRDAINSVTADATFHLVEKGETVYGLSKMYGVSEGDLINENNLDDGGLKAGSLIKIPVADSTLRPEPAVEGPDSTLVLWPGGDRGDAAKEGLHVRDFSGRSPLNVALLLPLKNDKGQGDRNYLDFYQGALLAFEDLKSEGVSANVSVYNTSRLSSEVYQIVESADFNGTDIIIGPVYEEGLAPVIDFAERTGAAVAFPLAEAGSELSPMLYQMREASANKYDKLKGLFTAGKNVVYISTRYPDKEMDDNIKPLLPANYKSIRYSGDVKNTSFQSLIDAGTDNVVLISCTSELEVEQILTSLSSLRTSLIDRSQFKGDLCVVGNSFWDTRFHNLDKELFFKLKVCYVSVYHADCSNERVRNFDKRYITQFGSVPTLYSYRGYDAAKLFISSAAKRGNDFTQKLNSVPGEYLLQMRYRFVQKERGGSFVNENWALVCYQPDYSIEVK